MQRPNIGCIDIVIRNRICGNYHKVYMLYVMLQQDPGREEQMQLYVWVRLAVCSSRPTSCRTQLGYRHEHAILW